MSSYKQAKSELKIRSGQTWKKKDSGALMVVTNKAGKAWTCTFHKKKSKVSHKVLERDIYKYYDLV